MACVLTLDNGKEMYTLTGEKGYVGCAILPKLWRMSSIFSSIVLRMLMLLLGSEVQIIRSCSTGLYSSSLFFTTQQNHHMHGTNQQVFSLIRL